MKFKKRVFKFFVMLFISFYILGGCKGELIGPTNKISPPKTKILNVPVPNTPNKLYSPILTVGWYGVSNDALIKGYWVSWKSYYLFKKDSVIQAPYFTEESSQTIPFPSADSINKQILLVKAEDNYEIGRASCRERV